LEKQNYITSLSNGFLSSNPLAENKPNNREPEKRYKECKKYDPHGLNFSVFVPIWGVYIHLETAGAVFAGLRENSITRLSCGYCKGKDAYMHTLL
jgi:hypothetical protein